jgi:DNA mismatch repair ATPase MutL
VQPSSFNLLKSKPNSSKVSLPLALQQQLYYSTDTLIKHINASKSTVVNVTLSNEDLTELELVSQVDNKFLLCLARNKILLVDQHAAHERVLLEAYLSTLTDTAPIHLSITLPLQDRKLCQRHKAHLQSWGLDVEVDTMLDCIQIRMVPQLLLKRKMDLHAFLQDVLIDYAKSIAEHKLLPVAHGAEAHWSARIHDCPRVLLEYVKSQSCRCKNMEC